MKPTQILVVSLLLLAGVNGPRTVHGDYLYWADQSNGTNAILRADLSALLPITDFELVVSDVRTRAMAVDSVNGKLYWGQDTRIWRSDPDGSNAQIVLENVFPQRLAIDPYNEQIYWSTDRQIHRANLDGTGDRVFAVADAPGGRVLGLALDFENEYVYWTEDQFNVIARKTFEVCATCSREVVVSGVTGENGFALDVADGLIFWASGFRIRKSDLNGSFLSEVTTQTENAITT